MVQAASVAYGFCGLTKWVENGGTLDKASMESDTTTFTGLTGLMVHGIFATMVIPIVALLFLIASFFSKIPGGILWALVTLVTVIVQVALGLLANSVPALGMLHGIVALVLFGVAITSAMRVPKALASRPAAATDPVSETAASTPVA